MLKGPAEWQHKSHFQDEFLHEAGCHLIPPVGQKHYLLLYIKINHLKLPETFNFILDWAMNANSYQALWSKMKEYELVKKETGMLLMFKTKTIIFLWREFLFDWLFKMNIQTTFEHNRTSICTTNELNWYIWTGKLLSQLKYFARLTVEGH